MKLIKERTLEVIGPAIGEWIEFVTIPIVFVTNLVGRVRCKNRDDVLDRDITLPLIKRALIAKAHPTLLTTFGTESWRWNRIRLLANDWGEFLKKGEILGKDLEARLTEPTRFLHGISIPNYALHNRTSSPVAMAYSVAKFP